MITAEQNERADMVLRIAKRLFSRPVRALTSDFEDSRTEVALEVLDPDGQRKHCLLIDFAQWPDDRLYDLERAVERFIRKHYEASGLRL